VLADRIEKAADPDACPVARDDAVLAYLADREPVVQGSLR
jgi:hypothetical protein